MDGQHVARRVAGDPPTYALTTSYILTANMNFAYEKLLILGMLRRGWPGSHLLSLSRQRK